MGDAMRSAAETRTCRAMSAIPDPRGVPQAGANNWGPGFLAGRLPRHDHEFEGTRCAISRRLGVSADADQRRALALATDERSRTSKPHPGDGKLAARIASYELAARMQLSVPEINDLSTEPAHILKLYGADDTQNADKAAFAKNCILARRLIEKGVRFVQFFNGAYASGGALNWTATASSRSNTMSTRKSSISRRPRSSAI